MDENLNTNDKSNLNNLLNDINKKIISTNKQWEMISEKAQTSLASIRKQITQIVESLKIKELSERLHMISETYRILTSFGWIFPYDINEADFLKQIQDLESVEDIDKYMMNRYGTVELIHNISINIKANDVFSLKLIYLIKEAINTYEFKLYDSCSIVLLTVIEGLIIRFADIYKLKYSDSSVIFKNSALKKGGHVEARYYYVINSICEFISVLYSRSDFSGAEPKYMNRHWLLHGRSQRAISSSDCVKLFLFIKNVFCFIEEIEAQSRYNQEN